MSCKHDKHLLHFLSAVVEAMMLHRHVPCVSGLLSAAVVASYCWIRSNNVYWVWLFEMHNISCRVSNASEVPVCFCWHEMPICSCRYQIFFRCINCGFFPLGVCIWRYRIFSLLMMSLALQQGLFLLDVAKAQQFWSNFIGRLICTLGSAGYMFTDAIFSHSIIYSVVV